MSRGPSPKNLVFPRRLAKELKALSRCWSAPHCLVQRTRIVLLARQGLGTEEIAKQVGCSPRNVRKWKTRFAAAPRVDTLLDRKRSGRPAEIPLVVRCELVQLACARPDGEASPFREIWTYRSLAEALEAKTGIKLSVSEVGRILRNADLRPHRVKQWLKSTDPDFKVKADRVCSLYLRPPEGAIVLSVDEKPMQALERIHTTHVDPLDGSLRYEYEYKRHGTQALLAAFEVGTGRVFGRVVPNRTAAALVGFMDELATVFPEQPVFVVWDNLNIHFDGKDQRWTRFNERHGHRFQFVYTPKHASWMNQIEIWFSILHRRVIRLGNFSSLEQQKWKVEGYIAHWNQHERHPFRWSWRTDLPSRKQRRKAAA